jgi:hypothetical protein
VIYLRQYVIIVPFVDTIPYFYVGWLNELQREIQLGKIILHNDASCGYSNICMDYAETT